jgi:hypothetical protein
MAAHLAGVEFEVEDVEVLGDPLGAHGLGDPRPSVLQAPAQHDLGGALAVRPGDRADHRVRSAEAWALSR